MRKKEKRLRKAIACERIIVLIEQALLASSVELAKNYIKRAWELKLRFNIKLSKDLSYSFCKKCFVPWKPGKTVSIKFNQREKLILYVCNSCGFVRRLGYSRVKEKLSTFKKPMQPKH